MFPQVFVILLSFALQAISTPPHQSVLSSNDACPTGAHVIVVRATTEEPGFGAMGTLTTDLLKRIPGSTAYPVNYPADGLRNRTRYVESEQEGVDDLNAHIKSFAQACPETKIVLLGYSQVGA